MLDRGFIKNNYVYTECGDVIYRIKDKFMYTLDDSTIKFYIKDNFICEMNGQVKYWFKNSLIYLLW